VNEEEQPWMGLEAFQTQVLRGKAFDSNYHPRQG
jgi:hypothetical protein